MYDTRPDDQQSPMHPRNRDSLHWSTIFFLTRLVTPKVPIHMMKSSNSCLRPHFWTGSIILLPKLVVGIGCHRVQLHSPCTCCRSNEEKKQSQSIFISNKLCYLCTIKLPWCVSYGHHSTLVMYSMGPPLDRCWLPSAQQQPHSMWFQGSIDIWQIAEKTIQWTSPKK